MRSSATPIRTVTAAARGWRILPIALLLAAAGCGRSAPADESGLLTTSGGDVDTPLILEGIDYTVTSEDYRRWMAAEGALMSIGAEDLSERIPLEAATDEDIDRVADLLEENERIRTAIESSGLSVKDYVRTTIALEQALAASRPESRIEFRQLPAENIILADRYGEEVERVRTSSPLRIVERRAEATNWRDDGDSDRGGKGKAKGKGKGKAKGKGKG